MWFWYWLLFLCYIWKIFLVSAFLSHARFLPGWLQCKDNKNLRIFWTVPADSELEMKKWCTLNYWHDLNRNGPKNRAYILDKFNYFIFYETCTSSSSLFGRSDRPLWPMENILLEKFAADFFEVKKLFAFWYKLMSISVSNVADRYTSYVRTRHLFKCFYHFQF